MNAPALRTRQLRKHFGGIVATQDVSISVAQGARHALIGPNGAGKTTLVNLLTGMLEPTAGSIELKGEDITAMAPHRRVVADWCGRSRSTSCSANSRRWSRSRW
jgi:ABC-type branched-subunit amino acid transport system ATPase component